MIIDKLLFPFLDNEYINLFPLKNKQREITKLREVKRKTFIKHEPRRLGAEPRGG